MNNVPLALKNQLAVDPEYSRCALPGDEHNGRVTWEHAIIFANRQLQERWAIVPICAKHHEVDLYQDAHTMDKDRNRWVALNRATDDELQAISKVIDYQREKARLNAKFGQYEAPPVPASVIPQAPSPVRKISTKPKVDELEREARQYARMNGCDLEEAREILQALV